VNYWCCFRPRAVSLLYVSSRPAQSLLEQNLEWAEEKRVPAKQVAQIKPICRIKASSPTTNFLAVCAPSDRAINKIIKSTEPGSMASRWLSHRSLAHEENHYRSHSKTNTPINLTGANTARKQQAIIIPEKRRERKQHAIDSIEAIATADTSALGYTAAETLKRHLSVTKKNLLLALFRTCEHARN
jgi:hypothetical protein